MFRRVRAGATIISIIGCGILLAGCAPPEEPVDTAWPDATAAIKGGEPDTTSVAVVAVTNAANGSLCTGSLIAPNVVLTARHCVSSSTGGSGVTCGVTTFDEPWPASGFFLSSAPETDLGNLGEFLVEAVVPLQGALAIPPHDDEDTLFCGNDVSALILKQNVDPAVAVPLEPRLTPVEPMELFSAVGYGAVDGDGNDSGVRRRLDGVEVVCRGTFCVEQGFEANDVHASEWVGGGGVCGGDSGGPALDAEGRVIGVTSRGDKDCNLSLYAGIPDYAGWLKNVVVLASGMGDYAPPAWTDGATVDRAWGFPVGNGCTADADCPSGICVENGKASYCSRPCETAAPCPEGFVCGGQGVCTFPPANNGEAPLPPGRPDEGCTVGGSGHDAPWWLIGLAWLAIRRRR